MGSVVVADGGSTMCATVWVGIMGMVMIRADEVRVGAGDEEESVGVDKEEGGLVVELGGVVTIRSPL